MKKYLYSSILYASLLLLTGCGFHLRGHEPLPPQLHTLYIQSNSPYGSLTKELNQTLQGAGVVITNSIKDSPIILVIVSETSNEILTSQGTSGEINTYLLTYRVAFQLINNAGKTIMPTQVVSSSRTYQLSSNQLLGDSNVESDLHADMLQDNIEQILTRLRSHNTLAALNKSAY